MLPNLQKYIQEADALGLDSSQYMITGSGILAALGIRDCGDLDLLVLDSLGETLKKEYPNNFYKGDFCDKLKFPNIELMWNFSETDRTYSSEQQLAEATIIDGIKYQSLEKVKFYKEQMGREKDLKDLELIKTYENQL